MNSVDRGNLSISGRNVIVTGGAGFIGSCLVERLLARECKVLIIDLMTYASNPDFVDEVTVHPECTLLKADISDEAEMREAINAFGPDAVFHLAAETHVDRSIDGPDQFIHTNIVGTYTLLKVLRERFDLLDGERANNFRFVNVSTDEVYGSLGPTGYFTEDTRYQPNSPYSASKAAADHLARAWFKTYGLPIVNTNCSNNFGIRQNREKFIPTIIRKAFNRQSIPVYGDGSNMRDWLYVDDHATGLILAYERGTPGQAYNFGGGVELNNLQLANEVCAVLESILPPPPGTAYKELISLVRDRPGHDFRYAICSDKAKADLGWEPATDFREALRRTVEWYLRDDAAALRNAEANDRLGLG